MIILIAVVFWLMVATVAFGWLVRLQIGSLSPNLGEDDWVLHDDLDDDE